jgi:hypothetical protein
MERGEVSRLPKRTFSKGRAREGNNKEKFQRKWEYLEVDLPNKVKPERDRMGNDEGKKTW